MDDTCDAWLRIKSLTGVSHVFDPFATTDFCAIRTRGGLAGSGLRPVKAAGGHMAAKGGGGEAAARGNQLCLPRRAGGRRQPHRALQAPDASGLLLAF